MAACLQDSLLHIHGTLFIAVGFYGIPIPTGMASFFLFIWYFPVQEMD